MSHEGPEPSPSWAGVVPHFHRLSSAELSLFPGTYSEGFSFTTIICQGEQYLPWLQRRLEKVRPGLALARPPEMLGQWRCYV